MANENKCNKHQKEYEEKKEKAQKWWNTLTLTEKKAEFEAEMKKNESMVRKNIRENDTHSGGVWGSYSWDWDGKKFTYQCNDYDKVPGIFIEGERKNLLSGFGWKVEEENSLTNQNEEEKLKTDLSNSHAELQKLESKLKETSGSNTKTELESKIRDLKKHIKDLENKLESGKNNESTSTPASPKKNYESFIMGGIVIFSIGLILILLIKGCKKNQKK